MPTLRWALSSLITHYPMQHYLSIYIYIYRKKFSIIIIIKKQYKFTVQFYVVHKLIQVGKQYIWVWLVVWFTTAMIFGILVKTKPEIKSIHSPAPMDNQRHAPVTATLKLPPWFPREEKQTALPSNPTVATPAQWLLISSEPWSPKPLSTSCFNCQVLYSNFKWQFSSSERIQGWT